MPVLTKPLYETFFDFYAKAVRWQRSGDDQQRHLLRMLRLLDMRPEFCRKVGRNLQNRNERSRQSAVTAVEVGGVILTSPLIAGAGLVKDGWLSGWQSLPLMVGAAEYGSFTAYPEDGNGGETFQIIGEKVYNRIGLRNHGIQTVSSMLQARSRQLEKFCWGISIAPSSHTHRAFAQTENLRSACRILEVRNIQPRWLTLNLSCPNSDSENDPIAILTQLKDKPPMPGVPLWIKLPDEAGVNYPRTLALCAEAGVKAVIIANNNRVRFDDDSYWAESGKGTGHYRAVGIAAALCQSNGYPIDVIASGGIHSGSDWRTYQTCGAKAGMLVSAFYTRGIMAPTYILREQYRGR